MKKLIKENFKLKINFIDYYYMIFKVFNMIEELILKLYK
jgi:hypothetical protein